MSRISWTEAELETIRTKAMECDTMEELAALFPNKTPGAVRGKFDRLKLSLKGMRKQWTEEEKVLLSNVYPTCGRIENILHMFPGRSYQSLQHQAERMGMEVVYWTADEDSLLRRIYHDKTIHELMPFFPGKTKDAITNRGADFGLKKTEEHLSVSQTGERNNFYGGIHTEETKEQLRAIWDERKQDPDWVHCWTGRVHTDETKAKISEFQKTSPNAYRPCPSGFKMPEEWKEKMRVPHVMSPEGSEVLRKHAMSIERHFGRSIPYTRKDGRTLSLDSSYELRAATAFDAMGLNWERNTTDGFQWTDANGKVRTHYPDFKLALDGIPHYLEVKGEHLLNDEFTIGGCRSYTITKAKASIKWLEMRKEPAVYMLISLAGVMSIEGGMWPCGADTVLVGGKYPEPVMPSLI